MICSWVQIAQIIKDNPAKARLIEARQEAAKMMRHVHGLNIKQALKRCDYFENEAVYKVREEYAISNKDMFGRLLEQENMVFTAKGGSSYFNLPEKEEKQMNALLEDVRHGMSLRKWIEKVALPAYRTDPMGIIFMEIEQRSAVQGEMPRTYPTYKSTFSVYDYDFTGRRLEYVCFELKASEALAFGVKDKDLEKGDAECKTKYYRFVDDEKDVIVKRDGETIVSAGRDLQLENEWSRTPGFIVSDLMRFYDPKKYDTPLVLTVELADCFFEDRSVRDLQKKFHGFSKAIEPMIDCDTCDGTKFQGGNSCPTCKGTGYKLQTKVSDVTRFPLDVFEKAGFDFKKVFGYVTPDVEGWEKQDTSLKELESLIELTYWGTNRETGAASGPRQGQPAEETATKTMANLRPRYARLNMTADWAERTESMVAEFIGQYWFQGSFKKASIAYGRLYILETPEELWKQYKDMRGSGAPVATMYEALEKYYHAMYQSNPMELAARLKMIYVEPFPHLSTAEAKNLVPDFDTYLCKLFFGEWYSTLQDIAIIVTSTEDLRQQLRDYVEGKGLKEPAPEIIQANQN